MSLGLRLKSGNPSLISGGNFGQELTRVSPHQGQVLLTKSLPEGLLLRGQHVGYHVGVAALHFEVLFNDVPNSPPGQSRGS